MLDELIIVYAKFHKMSRWKEKIQNKRTKKLLTVDDTTNNYLVYCPLSYEKPEDNWLLDIEMADKVFWSMVKQGTGFKVNSGEAGSVYFVTASNILF